MNAHRERMTGIGKGHCVMCREAWPCSFVTLTAKYLAVKKRCAELVDERDIALARARRAEAAGHPDLDIT